MRSRLAIVAVFFVLLATPLVAQSGGSWTTVARFDAPFEFFVSGTMLPPGHYAVQTYGTKSLLIQNIDTHQSAIAMTRDIMLPPNTTQDTTKVTFALDNNTQVLHQIRLYGDDHTHDLVHGRNLTELAPNR